jgi:hypothetical protein
MVQCGCNLYIRERRGTNLSRLFEGIRQEGGRAELFGHAHVPLYLGLMYPI